MSRPCFLQQSSPAGRKWQDVLQDLQPCVDKAGFLAGDWGNCLVEATEQEHTIGNYGQAGQVIDFLTSRGHRGYEKAADKLERLTHRAMRTGGIHRQPHSDLDPQAWAPKREAQEAGGPEPRAVSQSSSSRSSSSSDSSGSGSSGGRKLDPETKALCRSAPDHARIGSSLEQCVQDLPMDVIVEFTQRGTSVASAKRLKSSFHSTWLVEVSPGMIQDGKSYDRVIIQILGSQVGDQPLSLHISGNQIVKAMHLARRAGVRVPDVLFTGSCGTQLGTLDFIVQEYILTQTVEDVVKAPREEWHRIEGEVTTKLKAQRIGREDAAPVLVFESLAEYLAWFQNLVPPALRFIGEAIDQFARGVEHRPTSPALLHQDINCGNLLTSAVSQAWQLDAVIDWESAVVAPSDLLCRPREDKWRIAMDFGELAKGAWLAGCMADKTLPRCDLEALVENYTRAAKKLETRRLVRYQSWASLVETCQRVKGAGYAN